jgi:hypothetical protein
MKRGDEELNASSLQFLSSVKRFIASSLQFFLSVKRFIAVIFYGKPSFNASSPLLLKRSSSFNASSPLLFKLTLPTSGIRMGFNLTLIEHEYNRRMGCGKLTVQSPSFASFCKLEWQVHLNCCKMLKLVYAPLVMVSL